jgi:hypothetical protein
MKNILKNLVWKSNLTPRPLHRRRSQGTPDSNKIAVKKKRFYPFASALRKTEVYRVKSLANPLITSKLYTLWVNWTANIRKIWKIQWFDIEFF